MKSLDRMIKRERKNKYKMIKKVFRARDAASNHVDVTMRVSVILNTLSKDEINQLSTKRLAKLLFDARWMKPNPPPPRNAKPSITKL